jgi:hypothetical protein
MDANTGPMARLGDLAEALICLAPFVGVVA